MFAAGYCSNVTGKLRDNVDATMAQQTGSVIVIALQS